MTIVRRTRIGYLGQLFLLLVVAGVSVGGLAWLDSRYGDNNRDAYLQTRGAAAIVEASQPMIHITRASVLTESQGDRVAYVTDLGHAYSRTKTALDEMAALKDGGEDPGEQQALASLGSSLDEYNHALGEVVQLAEKDQVAALSRLEAHVEPLAREFDEAVRLYEDSQVAQVEAEAGSLSDRGQVLISVTATMAVLAIALGMLLRLWISRDIGRRLRGAITGLSTSSAEILSVASQVSAGAAQTAASTNEATATVEEVKQTTALAHDKASCAARGAQGAADVIGSAKSLVDETVQGIGRMQSEMGVVSGAIKRLSERAQAAGEVIAAVNDLAEQSNLLSVNASIEASKAGEYGKGFTVVAQEVKNLAEQSKQAVAQVRAMLGEIQKASQTAVEAAAKSREAVEEGRQRSVEAGEAMQRIVEDAGEDAEASRQVVASSQQQMAGMEQVSQAITSINEATVQAVSGTRQVEEEVRQLQELAAGLRSLGEGGRRARPQEAAT